MFITAEDPRARIKGSRDPLGVQPLWGLFGRHLVTNLTTVTTSVREFTVLLLGRYYGELLMAAGQADEDDAVPIFLRVEQLAAYARHVIFGANNIRGIERVRRFLDEERHQVAISSASRDMILSDQQMYGIWGLYSVSGRVSGLIEDGPVGLTPFAREFVESEYLVRLDSGASRRVRDFARQGGQLNARKSSAFLKTIAEVWRPTLSRQERVFYAETLRDAAHGQVETIPGRQARLAALIVELLHVDSRMGRTAIRAVSKAAEDTDPELARRLRMIDRLEALLAPAEALFELLLARNNQQPRRVAQEIHDVWGSQLPNLELPLEPLLSDIDDAVGTELRLIITRCSDALGSGDYQDTIDSLLDWNRLVMQRRGAAPWIKMSSGGRLDVRYRGEEKRLPSADELPDYWRNSYFLDSLASVTFQIENGKV